ncbi:MAG: cell division protein FtsA [Sphaerochaetaceae bacterium]|mgnify:FL=1|nr:cell division protein FtsA [Sphaerochaetaceae bacterium]
MASEKIMMGLDIGSSWVRAVIGSVSKDGQLMVDSICERPSEGVRNGVVVNVEQTLKTISSVIQEAELQAGVEVQSVITGIGGSTINGTPQTGVVGINSKDLEITSNDIYHSLEVARAFELPSDREILHTLVQDFSVDGKSGIKDPADMKGHRLESRVLIVTGSSSNCSNTRKTLQRAGINQSRFVLSQLADAEVVLSADEKEMGTILINIGGSTTNMIVYQNGSPSYVGGIDFGSGNVTNDIAYILNKPKMVAEQVKVENGSCYAPNVSGADNVIIPQVGGLPSIQMPKSELCKIIEPRMAEIFSLLKNELDTVLPNGTFGGGVVLVGGGSLLSGATDLASEIFRKQARIGFPEALPGLDRSYINPKYTTVLGLLKTEAKKAGPSNGKNGKIEKRSNRGDGVLGKLSSFFKKII